ncbi:MAG: hypothetical protein HONDAALG_04501 [Gammaproteobacteria bacterium]|nr:hypothetical protein [Gammaproteobacteria bacterium]
MPNTVISIAILAMGGEGGGVLADWIVDLAEHAGYFAQSTSVPGVAQRTGATIYYVEIFPSTNSVNEENLKPVLSLMPVPGHVDIVIASELMEAGRAIQRGLVSRDKTTLIASSHRVYSMTEKIAMGDGRIDSQQLISAASDAANRFVCADYAKLAHESGSLISAVLFGALAGVQLLPLARDQFEAAIQRGGVGIESSMAAFAAGFDSVNLGDTSDHVSVPVSSQLGPALAKLAKRIEQSFPSASHKFLYAGMIRLADYQDVDYASDYIDRLEPILELEKLNRDKKYRLLCETARYLALWMSYEDAVRVADLKIRKQRFERITRDVGCKKNQLLELEEFFHPRIEEIADIMPSSLGRWLLSSKIALRIKMGGRVVKTSSICGFLQLYLIAGLRRWRRGSLRFGVEQKRVLAWLENIKAVATTDYELAISLTESQRLIKGYGDTHHRGNANYEAVLGALPRVRMKDIPSATLKSLILAALADESGNALKKALQAL